MSQSKINELKEQLHQKNVELLKTMNEQAKLIQKLDNIQQTQNMEQFDFESDRDMLNKLISTKQSPFEPSKIEHIFEEIFKANREISEDNENHLLVSRKKKQQNTVIPINGVEFGNGQPQFIVGPCAVESYDQVAAVAEAVKQHNVSILRGGAFKPRTSPYDFQGLGVEGLEILKQVGEEYNLAIVSEIVHPGDMEEAVDYLDIIQIGSRNMQNFELLKSAGEVDKPILLKRGMSATIAEFIYAAEYIMSRGNGNIILCERGIRTYETATRNTLDISAVPILKQETHLPVMVDVTHSTGRRDLLLPAAQAALAIGVDGVMAEVHPDPAVALSDSSQQMDIPMFNQFMNKLDKHVTFQSSFFDE